MDQIESQVHDLRYLSANGMSALGETASYTPQGQSSPGSAVGNNSALHSYVQQGREMSATSSAERAPQAAGTPVSNPNGLHQKRKSIDESPNSKSAAHGQRSKRNRYISIACNECKRRKIKCNGETPCQRCGNLNLQCLYAPNCCSSSVKDSDEFKHMASQVSRLQEQVETLFSNLNALRSETVRLAPIQERLLPPPTASGPHSPASTASISTFQNRSELGPHRQASFRGPTSTHFSLDVAKQTLHKMGYSSLDNGASDDVLQQPEAVFSSSPVLVPMAQNIAGKPPSDPLWDFDKDEMIRLCRVYEEEVGIMYPVVKIDRIISYAQALASWMEAAKKNGLVPRHGQDGGMNDLKSLTLKTIMCCALVVEEHGYSEKGSRLFESVRATSDKIFMSEQSDVEYVPLLALIAGYRFLEGDEVLAWRTMGQAMRHCLELGLHRHETIVNIPDEDARRNAVHTFWSAYVLDRRWAFGTGLPYVMQDEDIDPDLPYPEKLPYLLAMVTYSRLSARVWRFIRHFDAGSPVELRSDSIEAIDQQIKTWYRDNPAEVQLELSDWEALPRYLNPPVNSQKEYDLQRLQIWTYLRLNQIRIWLYTPFLHTHSSIMNNLALADRVVKLAKNTIAYLTHLNNTTNLYRKIQVFYHQFLTSAITVLFLASCHAPVNFSATCRDEFYQALDLVKDLSGKSLVSKRLWRTIKSLREVAPRLGLAEDPHSNAALAMAGLATGQNRPGDKSVSPGLSGPQGFGKPPPLPAGAPPVPPPPKGGVDDPNNGLLIQTEMSRIWEGYMNQGGLGTGYAPGVLHAMAASGPPPMQAVGCAVDASVYSHFKDMF